MESPDDVPSEKLKFSQKPDGKISDILQIAAFSRVRHISSSCWTIASIIYWVQGNIGHRHVKPIISIHEISMEPIWSNKSLPVEKRRI